jgi:hypothetical protein
MQQLCTATSTHGSYKEESLKLYTILEKKTCCPEQELRRSRRSVKRVNMISGLEKNQDVEASEV